MDRDVAQDTNWKIEIVTWNIAGLTPPPDLDLAPLFGGDDALDADLIVIGLQEVDYYTTRYLSSFVTRDEPWSQLFREFLGEKSYVKLTCGWTTQPRLMGVVLMVFVSRKRLLNIYRVETKFCRTGLSGYSSHKGAVSVRLTLTDGSHIAFLCAHFAPCHESLAYRIKEYHMVLNSIQFGDKNIISDDYVFWLGDLNFRVEGFTTEESMRLIEHNYIEKLLEYDQLKRCVEAERAFYHFNEAAIGFKPTYKFVVGTNTYDSRRCPSWCDRILWRVENAHQQSTRQVFNLVAPQLVTFRYPSATGTWFTDQNNLCQYSVSSRYSSSMVDWIGVFKPGFKGDDEVVTWAYTITSWEECKESDGSTLINVLFKKQHIPAPGTYALGYYSRDRCCLISLSQEFEVASAGLDNATEAMET